MSSHPDADAFIREILRDPADVATRLVFADWLEETGESSNVAWARYIRLTAEADTHPDGSFERANCLWRAANLPHGVRATLELPAAFFVTHQQPLLRLLPAERFRVVLRGFTVPPEVVGTVSEPSARFWHCLPLAVRNYAVLLAVPDSEDWDRLRTLGFSLDSELLAVGAAASELTEAVNRHYRGAGIGDLGSVVVEVTDTAIELPEPSQAENGQGADPPPFRLDLGSLP